MQDSPQDPPIHHPQSAPTPGVPGRPYEAVVIGAGVMGCSIALELARRGHRPLVVDRGGGAGLGSTSSSSAIVRFHYSTPDAVALAWEAAHHWANWPDVLGVEDDAGMARFIRCGIVVLEQPDRPSTRTFELFDATGVPYEVLDADAVAARLPALDVGRYFPPKAVGDPAFWDDADGRLGAYVTPDGGYIDDPALAAHNLMIAAEAQGAVFRFRTEVTGFVIADGHVHGVELSDGTRVAAEVVVNAAGPHSSRINALAGAMEDSIISTRPLRQEVHVVPAPDGFDLAHGASLVSDTDLGTYFRPDPSGTVTIGGVEPECDPLVWIDDPDSYEATPTVEVWEAQTLRVARRLPGIGLPNRPVGLAALYDVSTDWLPIYDRTSLEGFYVAIGTSGNQFKNAPMVGPIMGELIDQCRAGRDHDRDPVHVTGPYTGLTIDVGSFSRLRSPQNTTNSVLG